MKLKDLIFNREKLRKYDELKEWKRAFDNESAKLSVKLDSTNAMEDLTWIIGVKLPDNIRKICVGALETEIKRLDEE